MLVGPYVLVWVLARRHDRTAGCEVRGRHVSCSLVSGEQVLDVPLGHHRRLPVPAPASRAMCRSRSKPSRWLLLKRIIRNRLHCIQRHRTSEPACSRRNASGVGFTRPCCAADTARWATVRRSAIHLRNGVVATACCVSAGKCCANTSVHRREGVLPNAPGRHRVPRSEPSTPPLRSPPRQPRGRWGEAIPMLERTTPTAGPRTNSACAATQRYRRRALERFEVADDDQPLRLTGRAVKRERCIVVFIAQHTAFNEVVLEVVREHQNIHAVGVSKQSEAHLGIVGCGVQPHRAF